MARTHARVLVSIWEDQDFLALPCRTQRLYLLLLSQRTVNYVGVLPLWPPALVALGPDATATAIDKALAELEERRFIVVDRVSGEIWIRTFIKHDGVMSQPNIATAALRALESVRSPVLRSAIEETYGAGLRDAALRRTGKATRGLPETRTERVSEGRAGERGTGEGVSTRSPERGSGASKPKRATAGSRKRAPASAAPADATPIKDALRVWALEHAPGVDVDREVDAALDWARSKDTRYSDWVAFARNWLRRTAKDVEQRRAPAAARRDEIDSQVRAWTPSPAEVDEIMDAPEGERDAVEAAIRARHR